MTTYNLRTKLKTWILFFMKRPRIKIINKKHKDWNWKKNDRHVISLKEKEKQEE